MYVRMYPFCIQDLKFMYSMYIYVTCNFISFFLMRTSVGDFGAADEEPFASIMSQYRPIPDVELVMNTLEGKEREVAQEVVDNVRPCYGVFGPPKGNSTCFQICE